MPAPDRLGLGHATLSRKSHQHPIAGPLAISRLIPHNRKPSDARRFSMNTLLIIVICLASPTTPQSSAPTNAQQSWHQWRGPNMNGVAPLGNPPTKWSEDKNIKWKTEIPGHGLSTPIIAGDLVIVQTAIPTVPPKEKPAEATP